MDSGFLAEIHPKVVHFPVALLTVYSLLEIYGIVFKKDFISKSALLILCLGVVAAFFAVLTGNQAADEFNFVNEASRALFSEHQNYATYLLWFSVILCGLRIFVVLKKKFDGLTKYIFIIFALLMIFFVYQTGMIGGELVKKYRVGTEVNNKSESE
jgi:uncharacterized membrane protein